MPQSEPGPHIVYRYTGDASIGEAHWGIPGRDLTDEDIAALPEGMAEIVARSRIYEAVAPEPAPTPSKKASRPTE